MNTSLYSEQIFDVCGRAFTALQHPLRVVSLVPSLTELLFDLGLNCDEIVGRTEYCIHPEFMLAKVKALGGPKTVDLPKLKAIRPKLVVAGIEENDRAVVNAIENDLGIPVFITNPAHINDVSNLIFSLGRLFNVMQRALQLIQRFDAVIQKIHGTRSGRVLYLIWRNPFMSAGPQTYIHSMLTHIGFTNVIDENWLRKRYGTDGKTPLYPVITQSDITELKPQIILFSSEPYPFTHEHFSEVISTMIVQGALLPDCRLVDGELYSWYGSRLLNIENSILDKL